MRPFPPAAANNWQLVKEFRVALSLFTILIPDVHGVGVLEEYPAKTLKFNFKKLAKNACECSS